MVDENDMKTITEEWGRRQGGWPLAHTVLTKKGMPNVKGKPAEEVKKTVEEYLKKLTDVEAKALIGELKALPVKEDKK